MASRSLLLPLLLVLTLPLLGNRACDPADPDAQGSALLHFVDPAPGLLTLPGLVRVEVRMRPPVDRSSLVIEIDGVPLAPVLIEPTPTGVVAQVPFVPPGRHELVARATRRAPPRGPRAGESLYAATWFELAALERPDECELLHSVHCLLPYPSSRFQVEDADTRTGLRLAVPGYDVPGLRGPPIDPSPLGIYDGFSPTAQILTHFPQGVDLGRSGAPVLLEARCCGQSDATPYRDVRTVDGRSLDPDSPTVILDAETGERVLHWAELDGRSLGPASQILFLRPGASLVPGHRYIVAMRGLQDPNGEPIVAEPAFRALRDRSPSTIPALEARRPHMERVFRTLRRAGIARNDLVLAFDFTVRSDEQLTERMLAMRDDSLEWLADRAPGDISGFQIEQTTSFGDCSDPAQRIWRRVRGRFAGPYYLTANIDDPTAVPLLSVDADGMPVRNGTHPFAFDVAVPCAVFLGDSTGHPLLLGHGLFGEGRQMVDGVVAGGALFGGRDDYIAGATDWRGLSGLDTLWLLLRLIGTTSHQLNNFPSLPARLKQGQVNTLVLARMMKSGFFNRLPHFWRVPGDSTSGVFPGPEPEMFYFGVSLGGIMGGHHAALSQDIERFNLDVPGMNFSLLLQRSTQFALFESLLASHGLGNPLQLALTLGLIHEAWAPAEPAGYVRHITGLVEPPLRDTPPKRILMTVAWLDKQVSNQATEVMARSMGLPSLVGSLQQGLRGMPDLDGGGDGLDSAFVMYDSGYFDVFDPAFDGVIPALANRIPSGVCDPHGLARLSIPASIAQLDAFLTPGGSIHNFCDGACDASNAFERPTNPCNPLP